MKDIKLDFADRQNIADIIHDNYGNTDMMIDLIINYLNTKP